jgi:ankyrin repeat protein
MIRNSILKVIIAAVIIVPSLHALDADIANKQQVGKVIIHIKDGCAVKFVPQGNKKEQKINSARLLHQQRVKNRLEHKKQKARSGLQANPDIIGVVLPSQVHCYAIAYGHEDLLALKKAIESKPYLVNKTNFYGDVPINIAVMCLGTSAVRMLIQSGSRVNQKNKLGLGTLDIASDLLRTLQSKITAKVRRGIVPTKEDLDQKQSLQSIIDVLKRKGAQEYMKQRRGTGTMYAYVMRSLLNNQSVDIHTDGEGNTMLHAAIMNKRIREAGFLLTHGASISAQNKRGYSPRDFAYAWYLDQYDNGEFIKLLEPYENNNAMQEDLNETYLYEVMMYMLEFQARAKDGEYESLEKAEQNKKDKEKDKQTEKAKPVEKVDELVRSGLPSAAQAVLPHKIFTWAKNNNSVALEQFITKTRPEHWKTARNVYGDTLLHIAVMFLADKSVQTLLQYGADVNVKNQYGLNPLDLIQSLRSDRIKRNKFKIKQGRKTTLNERMAAQRCRIISLALKGCGAYESEEVDYDTGYTYCTVMRAHVKNYDLNILFDECGNTLLHTAIARSNSKECQFLIDHGLSLFAPSKQGISCYDFLIALYRNTECDIFDKLTDNIDIPFMQVNHKPGHYDTIRKYVHALRKNSASRNRYGKQSQ